MSHPDLYLAWRLSRLPRLPAIFGPVGYPLPDEPESGSARLRAAGYLDGRGRLADDLHAALARFAHAPFEVDLCASLGAGRDDGVCAAMTASEDNAVLAVLDADTVSLREVPSADALRQLVDLLPPNPRAPGAEVALAMADVDTEVLDAIVLGADHLALTRLRERGVNPEQARGFIALVGGERAAHGRFGVAVRDGQGRRHRGSHAVDVVDTPAGRAAWYVRDSYWVAAPADTALVLRVLGDLLAAEQRRINGDR